MRTVMLRTLILLLFLWPAMPGYAADDLLEPDKAFRFSARMADPATIEVRFDIAAGYYMYRDKFRFSVESAAVRLGEPVFPPGKVKKDDFFGEVETYRDKVAIRVPASADAPQEVRLKVVSQGCADAGVCYIPQDTFATLKVGGSGGGRAAGAAPATPADEAGAIARVLAGGEFWVIVSSFLGFGLLLAFTPCVLPMIPILSGLIVGHGHTVSRARALGLSIAYVLGMSLTYTAAGVAAGLSGSMLAAALQQPLVLLGFAAVFVALSLSMFGLYDIALPAGVQTRLTHMTGGIRGGRTLGAFALGAASALIVSPCVAAPLAGALLYIGQKGDVVMGGVALFALALGMGIPLIVVGASAGALLPKAGKWMDAVKAFFGVLLLGMAIYIVSPLLPTAVQMALWGVLLMVSAMYLRAIDPLPHDAAGHSRLWKGVGLVALLAGASLLVGALSGGSDILQPLSGLRAAGIAGPVAGPAAGPSGGAATGYERVRSVQELDERIKAAAGKPVLLDFYADWCVSCKEMERFTMTDAAVKSRLAGMVKLQADVTANSDEDKALLKRFNLFGPPGIVFFDRTGTEIQGLRVIGFQSADKFAAVLDLALGR